MADIGFFVYILAKLPPAADLLKICKQHGINRLAFKVLNGVSKYNVTGGNDKPLVDYFDVLRAGGIAVEGWGYHYPSNPGAQGSAIEERRQKLGFDTYHLNIEKEWKDPYGMPKALKALLDPVKDRGFELLVCSYRYPSVHPQLPWDAMRSHEKVDGYSPQVYWALRHDPAVQLKATFDEYAGYGKPVYPLGATFGETFTYNGQKIWWEPTVDDLVNFRTWCSQNGVNRYYYYSLDWLLSKGRYEWLEAATGINNESPPPPPPPDPEPEPPDEIVPVKYVQVTANALNTRSGPGIGFADMGQLMKDSVVPVTKVEGDWLKCEFWIHSGYTKDVS